MNTTITNPETFIIDGNIRETYMNRVDVLEKVKDLLLLPNLEMATTKQVADFYEVNTEAIKKIMVRHRFELESDGMSLVKRGNIGDFLKGQHVHIETVSSVAIIKDANGNDYKFTNRGSMLFPRRAILRVGMLLRDSAIAKEVRTQLLNIEEKATQEVKVADINEEQSLQIAVGQAFMSGDINALAQAATGLMAFKNRHITEIENKLKEKELVVKTLAKEEVSFKNPEKVLQSLAARYGKAHGDNYLIAWKDLRSHLRYKVTPGINLKARKTRAIRSGGKGVTYPKVIKEHEFPKVISAMVALCENKGIKVTDILKEAVI
ncbi:hypothetical protein AAIE21_19840 [Paenibacillus sp. 102]|uniref:hypothetical protein n=1 Tax=Paenibacillus sp. 102 TaxID=3120823 RepID=UPI0031BB947E